MKIIDDPFYQNICQFMEEFELKYDSLLAKIEEDFPATVSSPCATPEETVLLPAAYRVVARIGDLPPDVPVVGEDLDGTLVEAIQAAFADHRDTLPASLLEGEDNGK